MVAGPMCHCERAMLIFPVLFTTRRHKCELRRLSRTVNILTGFSGARLRRGCFSPGTWSGGQGGFSKILNLRNIYHGFGAASQGEKFRARFRRAAGEPIFIYNYINNLKIMNFWQAICIKKLRA
jgi:hypothetical protein